MGTVTFGQAVEQLRESSAAAAAAAQKFNQDYKAAQSRLYQEHLDRKGRYEVMRAEQKRANKVATGAD